MSAILHYLSSTALQLPPVAAVAARRRRMLARRGRTSHSWRRRRSCIAHVTDVVRHNLRMRANFNQRAQAGTVPLTSSNAATAPTEDLDVVRASTLGRRRCYCTICNSHALERCDAVVSFRPIGQIALPSPTQLGQRRLFRRLHALGVTASKQRDTIERELRRAWTVGNLSPRSASAGALPSAR